MAEMAAALDWFFDGPSAAQAAPSASSGARALFEAAAAGDAAEVARLRAAGAPADARVHGMPALCAAARKGHVAVLDALLRPPPPGDRDDGAADRARCEDGRTALMLAAFGGHDAAVAALLAAGASPRAEDASGASALHAAAHGASAAAAAALLGAGAAPRARMRDGREPAHCAAA